MSVSHSLALGTQNPGFRPLPDDSIAESAESRLRGNAYLALKNIRCDVHGGVLKLSGCLPSYYLKQLAQEAVLALGRPGEAQTGREIGLLGMGLHVARDHIDRIRRV